MSFEAEVIPLFIGGVAIVSALELIAGCVLLRNLREARNRLIAHTVCMIIAQLFLIRSIFANWLGVKFKNSCYFQLRKHRYVWSFLGS